MRSKIMFVKREGRNTWNAFTSLPKYWRVYHNRSARKLGIYESTVRYIMTANLETILEHAKKHGYTLVRTDGVNLFDKEELKELENVGFKPFADGCINCVEYMIKLR